MIASNMISSKKFNICKELKMRIRISDEIIEIAKKHQNANERVEIYGKAVLYAIEKLIIDERMSDYLDPNQRRKKKMLWNQNSAGHTDKQSGTDCWDSVGQTVKKNRVGHTVKDKVKTTKTKEKNESLAIYINNNNQLYDIVNRYITSNINTWNISYLIKKHWELNYIYSQMLEAEKVIKQVWLQNFITILSYIKHDEFWSNQILSIAKLNRKNKDGVPYYIVIMDKIKEYKPTVISIPTV